MQDRRRQCPQSFADFRSLPSQQPQLPLPVGFAIVGRRQVPLVFPQQLVTIIDKFGSTLSTLADHRNDVTRLLRETANSSTVLGALVTDREAQIDRVLTELATDLKIIDEHQVDLAHVFAYAGVSFEGFASIGYQNGPAKNDNPTWGNVFVTELGAASVEDILGCGSALDEALTAIIGPDPSCDGVTTAPAGTFVPTSASWGEVSGFFSVPASSEQEVAR